MKISEFTFSNARKAIRAKYKQFLEKQYIKQFSGLSVKEVIDRTLACHECAKRGRCVDCGCSFVGMVIERKPCKNFKPDSKTVKTKKG